MLPDVLRQPGYCKRECQLEDWKRHKEECKSDEERAKQKGLNEALWHASKRGQLRAVLGLIAQGAEVKYHHAENDRFTALHVAASRGHVSLVDALLSAGSEVEAVNILGATACHCAALQGHAEVLRSLVSAGADVNRAVPGNGIVGETTLKIAAWRGHAAAVDVIISAGAVVDLLGDTGYTALHVASQEGMLQAVGNLIRGGADVNLATSNELGDSPIILAAMGGHTAVIKSLAEARADVNFARAGDGCSAIFVASQQGHEAAVRALLSVGADPRRARTDGATALALAKQCSHPAIAALLEAKLAELDSV